MLRSFARSVSAPFLLALVAALGGAAACGAEATPSPIAPTNGVASSAAAGEPAAGATVVVTPELEALVAAADRSPEDRALDAGRHPAELLAFAGVSPGMRVADLGAAGGYTTELLARAVGPSGTVYGQNVKFVLERFAAKPWGARLEKPAMKNVVRVDRELEDPLPPEAHDLDAVLFVLFYHDTVWLKVDRDKMNQAVFRALKPGGHYVIVDHSALAGTGISAADSLHRIDEQAVKDEVAKAGFQLTKEGDFLRNPADSRDWNAAPMAAGEKRGTSDRFALVFTKPAS